MREQGEGGRLIVVGSPAGQRGNFGQTNYAAAKAGIAAMARTWAHGAGQGRDHGQRRDPDRRHRDDQDDPGLRPVRRGPRGSAASRCPTSLRQGQGFGTPEDCAGLVAFLASDAARGITGQCIGIGGDQLSLWSHPQEVAVAYPDGGWSADAIADAWPVSVGREPQSYGIPPAP